MDRLSAYCSEQTLLVRDRILSLLDRDTFSRTYGCFDKNYHYLRKTDFPNAAAQMSALTLIRFGQVLGTDELQKSTLLRLAKAAFLFTWSIQNHDGSFDEWYPNERGWAGPTGYLLHTQIETFLKIKNELSVQETAISMRGISQAAKALGRKAEIGDLANHYAIALLALYQAAELLDDDLLRTQYNALFLQFESLCHEEGWSLEYDGVDISYNLATLSFLARLHRLNNDARIKSYAEKSFNFLKYFFYPDGTFSGAVSSRHTSHFYPLAVRYWSQHIATAQSLLSAIESEKWPIQTTTPKQQDDHYVHYLTWDYLDAIELQRQPHSMIKTIPLPIGGDDFEKHFTHAGLFVKKQGPNYTVVNLKRGGATLAYDIAHKRLLLEDCGYVLKLGRDDLYTTLISSRHDDISLSPLSTTVPFGKMFSRRFNTLTLILFRLAISLSRHPVFARWMKGLIRRSLIFQKANSSAYLKRSWEFSSDGGVLIHDTVTVPKSWQTRLQDCHRGGAFYSRYVPQSRYMNADIPHRFPVHDPIFLSALKTQGRASTTSQI